MLETADLNSHQAADEASIDSEQTDFDGYSPVPKEKQEEIAKNESMHVYRLRVLVLTVLLFSAIAVSMTTYFYLSGSEQNEFEAQFHSDATKVLDGAGKILDDTLGATDAFIVKLMAYAKYSNSTWPFVAMPSFGIQQSKLIRISKAYHMSISPFVSDDQRDEWQKFATENGGWFEESLALQAKDEDWKEPTDLEYVKYPEIIGMGFVPSAGPSPWFGNLYMPSWQNGPVLTGPGATPPYNWDSLVVPSVALTVQHAVQTNRVVISGDFAGIVTDPEDPLHVATAALTNRVGKRYLPDGESAEEPSGMVCFPMIDNLDTLRIDPDKDHKVVGSLNFLFYYREIFRDILPSHSKGIILVMKHSCGKGQAFTYQLDGAQTTYLGVGDLHDEKYDYLGYSATLGELMDTSETERISHYTGLPLADDYCTKIVSIYPSQGMEDEFTSGTPIIFTCLVAAIFLFTSLAFFGYDYLVARRQRIVMTRALASGAIVSSLFPEQVRNQLYAEKKQEQTKEAAKTDFMNTNGDGASLANSRPIADLYEETTIFFMDLAGFTKWSSTRTPIEVFELLEHVYGAFDAIAARRGVFKVETIGDCYVAVTGIPNPQEEHAVIMVKFARDCMLKFSQLTNDLVDSLGADTAELEMRVGLHSGSTTGGVLRGDKGRFQLFGDTVNTASRMESNGVRGRIHCSQSTADALTAKGKGNWLTPREDKIVAKGKGEMQTYFVDPSSGTGRSSVRTSSNMAAETAVLDLADEKTPADNLTVEQRLANRLNQNTAGSRFEMKNGTITSS